MIIFRKYLKERNYYYFEEEESDHFHDCDLEYGRDADTNFENNDDNENEANEVEEPIEMYSDAKELQIDESVVFQSDEAFAASFVETVQKCVSGSILFDQIQKLPNTGSKLGVSLTMNRAIKALSVVKKLDAETGNITWGKCKKGLREKLCQVFADLLPETADWLFLSTAILEPFLPKKIVSKKVMQMRNADADTTDNFTNRVADRVALLSCALADTDMLRHWVDVAKPIDASSRPGKFIIPDIKVFTFFSFFHFSCTLFMFNHRDS